MPRRHTHPRAYVAVLATLALFAAACGLSGGPTATPTATLVPDTPTPRPTATPRPSPTPPPSPTPVPQLKAGDAIVVGGELRTRSAPTSQSAEAGTLANLAAVEIKKRVAGENWLVGSQTWVTVQPNWATEWLQLADGNFVYSAFVFI